MLHNRLSTMNRQHSPHNPQRPTTETHANAGASRWLVLVVALFGGFAGGSIVEVIAALASNAPTALALNHLIAAPLALAGTLCGAFLAGILVSKDHSQSRPEAVEEANSLAVAVAFTAAQMVPCEPMIWQPTPPITPLAPPLVANTAPHLRHVRHPQRVRRAIRHHQYSYSEVRVELSRRPAMN